MKKKSGMMVLTIKVTIMIFMVWLICSTFSTVLAETSDKSSKTVYVKASLLNGRRWPTKKASIEAYFDYGDELQPTGNYSKDRKWIEVIGGETGTVWVDIRYVSERMQEFTVCNENNGRVKIRSKPFSGGKVNGYLKHGKSIEIDQVVLGWGHCSKGWVDLEYLIEEVDSL